MKKTLAILLAFILLSLSLAACSGAPKINKETWSLATVTENETLVYVASKYASAAPSVPQLDCTLTAKRGSLTITENETDKTYTGTYTDADDMETATDYRITVGKAKGQALVAYSEDTDGNPITTLTLYIKDYVILFVAD